MSRFTQHHKKPEAPAAEATAAPTQAPTPISPGWRICLGIWLIAFLILFGLEIWDFLWKSVRGFFVSG